MDRGDLQAIVHDIAKSQTGLSNWAHTQLHPQWHFQLKPNQKTLEIREESALKKKKKFFLKAAFHADIFDSKDSDSFSCMQG